MKTPLESKFFLALAFFGIICAVFAKTGDVIFVNIMARHGARTPTWFYENDKNKHSQAWKEGSGVLTTEGKEQTYELGLWLYKRYSHLLTDKSKVYVRTTDSDRVKLSAKCCLAAMFSSHGGSSHGGSTHGGSSHGGSTHGGSSHGGKNVDCTTSIQLHSEKMNDDYLLGARAPCKKYTEELDRVYKSTEIENKNKKFKKVYETINTKSGSKGRRGDRVEFIQKIYDLILVEQEFHLKSDQWALDMMKPMKEAAILSFTIPTWNDELKKLKSGPMVGEMIKDMKAKKDNQTKYNMKLYMAHDMTIVSFLNTLGVYDMKELPDYASCVMLELIEEGKGKYSVKLYYSQSTKPHAKLLESMSLEKFIDKTKKIIPLNWHAECNK